MKVKEGEREEEMKENEEGGREEGSKEEKMKGRGEEGRRKGRKGGRGRKR